ncbi:hypothetical protein DXG03_003989 [Asterophora parasitica]|uniref:DUF2433 domain-containing protein n=1 Tax=Asterophora parasitica TaxID=117018 RepID=A0A9P7G746_9AGAR|nr:hypothetical protein DXG03_003989 [Asterophora parasitica]
MSRPASTSTRPGASPLPRAPTTTVNTQTKVLDTAHGRILCIADIRGRLSALNDLAREANAQAIIHTGDFGFFESTSLDRINDRTLRHLTMYSPLIPSAQRTHLLAPANPPSLIRSTVSISLLSEFPLLLSGTLKLAVPVYTVWGACEDVLVLEKFRSGAYAIDNLHVLDEATTRAIDLGGVRLRLLGLGGALVPHKMFDNGEGNATIAGGQGTMWTTALQIGELVDTAQRVYDPTETRLLVTHTSPGREGIIAQLALVTKADLTISAGLHFRYATSYNEFSVQGDYDGFRHKLTLGKEGFDKVWETVRPQVEAVIDDNQKVLLDKALSVIERVPPVQNANSGQGEEPAWKNCWNWNLCDAAYGSLVLDVKEGRVSSELKSQGFNYAYRRTATTSGGTPTTANVALPGTSQPPTKGPTPQPPAPEPAPTAAPSLPASQSAPSQPVQPASPATTTATGKDSPVPKANGEKSEKDKERAEKEKAKKKEKKERKERERAEREAAGSPTPNTQNEAKGTKASADAGTPKSVSTPLLPESTSAASNVSGAGGGPKSPTTGTEGARTPKSGKPARNPWTIFLRMPSHLTVTDPELKDFFGSPAKEKIMKIHHPTSIPGRAKIAYVEFEDEQAMRLGLEGHKGKVGDVAIEVKQATDRESRGEGSYRGGPGGRGAHGRGRGGGYAARGFAAAGLTRGGFGAGRGEGASGGADA